MTVTGISVHRINITAEVRTEPKRTMNQNYTGVLADSEI